MTPYNFALLRYMHSAVAGELVNIGVVMWVPQQNGVLHFISDRYSRLSGFYSEFFDGTAQHPEWLG